MMQEFAKRRAQLMQLIGQDGIAIIPGAPTAPRNRDVYYPYRQDSDFYYLSGFAEPDAVIVLVPGREQSEYLLFCRERDRVKEQWEGRRAGQKGARQQYGADDSFPIDDLDEILPGLLENKQRVFYTLGLNIEFDHRVIDCLNELRSKIRAGIHVPQELVSLEHRIHEMRLFKSEAEIAIMQQAADISAAAHRHLMQTCQPGMMEYQLEAEFQHQCALQGARHQAYSPIVGGGRHACILHYTENSAPLRDGDLVLIDAGCEFQSYASDITRTFPVNGRFSEAQRAVYEVVLEAQLAAIDQVKPGNHWNDPHLAAVKVLTQGLVKLGILQGKVAKLIKDEAYRPFFMHRTGHWLGMDVHDVGEFKTAGEWRELKPGMVLTVEPGLYIPRSRDVDKRWWHIGIRIEDDVLVTTDGHRILSAAAPKTVADIEALMQP